MPTKVQSDLAEFIAQKRSKRVYCTSRSAAITHQRCPRRRWQGYHQGGTGITKIRLEPPLVTGGYTHVGLAELMKGQTAADAAALAVQQYKEEFAKRGLELEATEDQQQVAREQIALTEAFLHLVYRRVLPAIREEYEIVDVEREEWFVLYEDAQLVVVMETRSDGLLRERSQSAWDNREEGGDLYVLSWKTAATWDRRKAREAKTDMQGLSEAHAIELRLQEPILGTKMVHLLKGRRKEYPEGSGQWIQSSPLVHAWMNGAGPTPQFAWTFYWQSEEVNEYGKAVNHRLGKGWHHVFIPDVMPVAEWVQMLDEGHVQPEAGDALERQFISPMPEPRSPEQKQRWLAQIQAQEVEVAMRLREIEDSVAPEDLPDYLDAAFPQFTHSCNYPGACAFWDLCWGNEDVENPITLYQVREPHHPGESLILGDE